MVLYVYFAYLFFLKRLFYCSEMYKCLHETVPYTSLHETSDLIQAIEILIVETTLMLKAIKNFHYNKKKKHCNIRVDVIQSSICLMRLCLYFVY